MHPTAKVDCKIAAERGIDKSRSAANVISHPTTVLCNVAAERSVRQLRITILEIANATTEFTGIIAIERAVGQHWTAYQMVVHPATIVECKVTAECGFDKGRAAA